MGESFLSIKDEVAPIISYKLARIAGQLSKRRAMAPPLVGSVVEKFGWKHQFLSKAFN